MSGLFQRAKSIRERFANEQDIGFDLSPLADISDIPEEEQNTILTWIEKNLEKGRVKIQDKSLVFKFGRRGILMPLLVNLTGIILIAAGAYFFYFFYSAEQETMVSSAAASTVAQSRIIQALKEEAERQLNEKEQEISDVQRKLNDVSREREALKANIESQLAQREEELQLGYAAEIDALRERLQSEGASDEAISEQVAELEAQKKLELEQALATLQAEMDVQYQELEAEILARENEFRESLETAQLEYTQLEQQASAREAELETARSEAFAEIEQIRARQEQQQAILKQIRTFYQRITSSISAGRYPESINHIDSLEEYLQREEINSMPEMGEQVNSDLAILRSIRSMVDLLTAQDAIDPQQISEAAVADFIDRINEDVASADVLFDAGEIQAASAAYLTALSAVAGLLESHERLLSLQDQQWADVYQAESRRLTAAITEWQGRYENDIEAFQERVTELEAEIQEDSDEYSAELSALNADIETLNADVDSKETEIDSLNSVIDNLRADLESQKTTYQTDTESLSGRLAALQQEYTALQETSREEAERAENVLAESKNISTARALLLKDIVDLRTKLAQDADQTDQTAVYTENELVKLLQTKLIIRNVLNTESVRAEYPDLLDDMEDYFSSIRAEQENETEAEVLRSVADDLRTILDRHE